MRERCGGRTVVASPQSAIYYTLYTRGMKLIIYSVYVEGRCVGGGSRVALGHTLPRRYLGHPTRSVPIAMRHLPPSHPVKLFDRIRFRTVTPGHLPSSRCALAIRTTRSRLSPLPSELADPVLHRIPPNIPSGRNTTDSYSIINN